MSQQPIAQDIARPCLHILNKAPGHPRTTDCRAQLAAGDQLLLIESGVLALTDLPWLTGLPQGVAVMVLAADLSARGLSHNIECNVQIIDYDGFVALAAERVKIQHW